MGLLGLTEEGASLAVLSGENGSQRYFSQAAFARQMLADGPGLRCALQRFSLRELVSSALDSDALKLMHDDKLELAEGVLREAVEVNGADATAIYNLACVLARTGRGDEALEKLERAFALEPQR